MYVRFEVFTAVTMKNAVFWDVAPCTSCVNRRSGEMYRLHLQGRKIRVLETSVPTASPGGNNFNWTRSYVRFGQQNVSEPKMKITASPLCSILATY
jgi:hypothetical protein